MEIYIAELRGKLSREVALGISNQIDCLPPARFGTRRLHLPCIVFSVRKLDIHGRRSDNEKVYHAKVSLLGDVEFATTDDPTPGKQKTLVFAHPWIRYIRGLSGGVTGENDSESSAPLCLGLVVIPGLYR